MNMNKYTLFGIFTLTFSMLQVFGGGLYLVSSADFRKPVLKYVIETTTPNQEVEVTPYAVKLCSTIGNGAALTSEYAKGGWDVKYDGINHEFSKIYAMRQDIAKDARVDFWKIISPLAGGTTTAEPILHTYATPGKHMVNVYAPTWNIFNVMITNPAVTEVCINYEDCPYSTTYSSWGISVVDSPNIHKLVYKNPIGRTNQILRGFHNLTGLREFKIKHPENITELSQDIFIGSSECTNAMVFINLKKLNPYCFRGCKKINYVSVPRVETINNYAFYAAYVYQDPSWGIKTLRIGDRVSSVSKNALQKQCHLETIEFVTDNPNWIEAWNNHPILSVWFGPASNQVGNEATLTPLPSEETTQYYDYSDDPIIRPRPTKLVYVGGYDVN